MSVVTQPDINAKPSATKRYSKVPDIATLLAVPTSTVYDLVRQNRIVGVVRFGRHIRFDMDKLERWLQAGGENGSA